PYQGIDDCQEQMVYDPCGEDCQSNRADRIRPDVARPGAGRSARWRAPRARRGAAPRGRAQHLGHRAAHHRLGGDREEAPRRRNRRSDAGTGLAAGIRRRPGGVGARPRANGGEPPRARRGDARTAGRAARRRCRRPGISCLGDAERRRRARDVSRWSDRAVEESVRGLGTGDWGLGIGNAVIRHFASAADFRAWLETHGGSSRELWVGFYKKASGRGGLTYKEAVDEALCFGWIDGIKKRVDESSFTHRFTPRTASSIWSAINLKRMKELLASGRVADAGRAVFERRDPRRARKYSFENPPAAFNAELERRF